MCPCLNQQSHALCLPLVSVDLAFHSSQEEPFKTYKNNLEEYKAKVKAQVQLLRE